MATFNRPFGSNTPVTKVDYNNTPQQKKFEAATGKDSDSAVGDVDKKKVELNDAEKRNQKVNKDLWAEAEHAALNQTGGFSGSSKDARKALTQEKYDQMVANDKKLKEGFSGILGDV